MTDSNYVALSNYYQNEPNLQPYEMLNSLSSWMTAHCNTKSYDEYRQYLIDLLFVNETALGIEEENNGGNNSSNAIYNLLIRPNPASDVSEISFSLRKDAKIKVAVYDVTGAEQEVLSEGVMKKGNNMVKFDVSNYPDGIYFVVLYADGVIGKSIKTLVKN